MIADLKTLYRYRELLYMFSWRDIRIRYKQSVMGLLWAVFMPALVVGAGVLVTVAMAHYGGKPLTREPIIAILVKGVAWTLFMSGLRFGTNSLVGNASLVTRIAFPKEVFPLAAIVSSVFDFLIAAAIALALLLVFEVSPTIHWLLAIPLLMSLIALTTGLAFVLSAANLYYRDVKYLVEAILSVAIFFTPVLYSAQVVGQWKPLLMVNPVAPLLEALDAVVIRGALPEKGWTLYSIVASVLFLVVGYRYFKRLETRFAENI
jgi:ABC-type polysaccharide/polyol phosphate export permease